MKTISLWQPWASAIAVGAKRIETRSWRTEYRGPLAIHAAKRCVKAELTDLFIYDHWRAALASTGLRCWRDKPWDVLPFGSIVAVAQLVDCVPINTFIGLSVGVAMLDKPVFSQNGYGAWTERQMGNFGPGRYAWFLQDVRPLETPILCHGRQRLFNVPDSWVAGAL